MNGSRITRGQILPHDQFDALFGDQNSVRAEASRIIQEAQEVASALREEVSAESSRLNKKLSQISDEELKQFIDTEMIDRSVEAFAEMLHQSAKFKATLLDLSPWLINLVETCVRRLINSLDDTDLVSRLVSKGVEEFRDQTALTLTVHPDCNTRLQATVAAYPERFSGITHLVTSAQVPSGLVRIHSSGGLVDVDLSAQLDRLITFLEAECTEIASDSDPPELFDTPTGTNDITADPISRATHQKDSKK